MTWNQKKPLADTAPKRAGGQRVDQEKIDQMVAHRRQGVGYQQIAERVGCSVRTVQRYVKNVEPQLQVPQAGEQRERDPRMLRQQILRQLMDELFRDNQLAGLDFARFEDTSGGEAPYDGPPSLRFLNEAERLLRVALQSCGDVTVRLIATSMETQRMFVGETIGTLRDDYRRWVFIMYHYDGGRTDGWKAPSDRTPHDVAKLKEYDWLYRTILRIAEERR
jgi:AcrR family transcriptional regulator